MNKIAMGFFTVSTIYSRHVFDATERHPAQQVLCNSIRNQLSHTILFK